MFDIFKKTNADEGPQRERRKNEEIQGEKAKLCCSTRLMIAFIATGTLLLNYAIIFNLGFAILCMNKQIGRHGEVSRTSYGENKPEFDWGRTTQGLVLSAFFVGFAVTLVMGGILADMYGAKLLLVVGTLCQGVMALTLPELTRALGPTALAVLRILQGFAGGVVVPSVYVLLSKWAAKQERTRLLGLAYLGIPLSEIVVFPMSGALCTVPADNGWPFIFYLTGGVTASFTLLLQFLVSEWPSTHPFITDKERAFLEANSIQPTKKKRPPWKKIMGSGAVWAYILCYLSQQWGFQVMSIFTPDFMKDVMKFDIRENGALSAIPFIGMLIMRMTQTSFFNWIRIKTNLSLTKLRKINHAIGTVVPAISLCCMQFVKGSPAICIILLTINMTIQDLAFTGGFGFCNVDFAPAFSGIISGVGMSVSIVVCIAMPNIVAALTPTGAHSEWMVIFYITAASYIMAFIVYNRLGTSELQPWGLGSEEETDLGKADSRNIEDMPVGTPADGGNKSDHVGSLKS